MKIIFSMSIAALLGFTTFGPVQAQHSPNRLWDETELAPEHNLTEHVARNYPPYPRQTQSVLNADASAPCPPGSPCANTTHRQAPFQSAVPYFYGGSTATGCDSGGCADNSYQSAMRGTWGGQQNVIGGKSCSQGKLTVGRKSCKSGGLFSSKGSSKSCSSGNKLFAGGGFGKSFFAGGNSCGQSQWIGGANGLIFFRDKASEVFLTYPNGDPRNRVLTTRSVDGDMFGGVEASLGRRINPGLAVIGTYWGLYGAQDEATYTGDPETFLTGLSNLTSNGSDVETLFNSHDTHRVRMQDQIHNAEINMVRSFCATPLSGRGRTNRFDLLAGARYFNFSEEFQYAGAIDGTNFGGNNDDVYYDIDVDNYMYGVQIGGVGNYCVSKRMALRVGTKLGVYNNHIEHDQRIYGPAGNATINAGSYAGQDYDFSSDKDDVAFLGELDFGLQYAISNNWNANIGYRGVFVNGVAHTTDQIPSSYTAVPGILQVNSNGSMILHGVYMGATFNY